MSELQWDPIYKGSTGNVRIWNRPLTDYEIALLAAQPDAPIEGEITNETLSPVPAVACP